MSVLLVLTILIPSITCSPLFAQTPFTSPDYDFNTTKEQALPSPSFTSSPLKNYSTLVPQPSNIPVHKTTAVLTPKNTAITVAEAMAESILETTIVALLKTTEVTSTDSEHTFEEAPLPTLEILTTSIHQTSGVTKPQTPIQTSQHGSTLISTQATNQETFTSSSTSQTGQSTTKGTAEYSITSASNSYPTKIRTAAAPSINPESAQTTRSKPSSDPKSTPAVSSATTRDMPITSSKTYWFVIVIIVLVVCISGIIFMSMLFNKRKKKRSENFSSSFRNGGSSNSKRKKGTEDDAWFGPVAFKGEDEVEAGGEGSKEVDGKREGEGVQVVLSTFMAKEEKDEVNGGYIEAMKDMRKEEEVPLLVMDEDLENTVTSLPPISSSFPPALSDTDAGEQNGRAAFCLTSAV